MIGPEVSIVCPVYNMGRFLEASMASILRQSFRNWELIAVDDGSGDDSGAILDRLAGEDPRIRVIHQSNQGLGKALATGVSQARGEFVARMDPDDLSAPKRLERQVEYLCRRPEAVMVGCWAWVFSLERGVIAALHQPDDDLKLRRRLEAGSNIIVHGTVMFRRTAYEKTRGYRFPYFGEDYDLWLQLMEYGRLGMVESFDYLYQRAPGSTVSAQTSRAIAVRRLALRLKAERGRLGREVTGVTEECEKIRRAIKPIRARDQLRFQDYAIGMELAQRNGERLKALRHFRRAFGFDVLGLKAIWRSAALLCGRVTVTEDSLQRGLDQLPDRGASGPDCHWAEDLLERMRNATAGEKTRERDKIQRGFDHVETDA